MIRLALVTALVSGCSIGGGSAYVGQWRPHTEIVMNTCRADEHGTCLESKQITNAVPARGFWGFDIAFPATGVAFVSKGGMTATKLRLELPLEILSGRGSTAIGVRTTAALDVSMSDAPAVPGAVMIPIDVLGHLSLRERFGIYGGLGYVPFARAGTETTSLGGRAIAGMQYALGHDLLERYILLNVEASHTWLHLDAYHSTAVTANIGIYF